MQGDNAMQGYREWLILGGYIVKNKIKVLINIILKTHFS